MAEARRAWRAAISGDQVYWRLWVSEIALQGCPVIRRVDPFVVMDVPRGVDIDSEFHKQGLKIRDHILILRAADTRIGLGVIHRIGTAVVVA